MPIDVIPDGSVTDPNTVHPLKRLSGILVIPEGIVIEVKSLQLSNAPTPKLVNEFGSVIDVIPDKVKPLSPILVKPDGSVIDFKP